jgi:hypothetical protein
MVSGGKAMNSANSEWRIANGEMKRHSYFAIRHFAIRLV